MHEIVIFILNWDAIHTSFIEKMRNEIHVSHRMQLLYVLKYYGPQLQLVNLPPPSEAILFLVST